MKFLQKRQNKEPSFNRDKNLKELNNQISNDANNLANALKGQSKIQGDWGEMILESILNQSGLRRDLEYKIQNSFKIVKGKL